MNWTYEKLDENGNVQYCPANDTDGTVTGHIVMNVKAWFDENPAERIRLGWIKHYHCESVSEIQEKCPYDPQMQYLICSTRQIDEHSIEDVYHAIDKTEEMMLLEEMLQVMNLYVPAGRVILDSQGGILV